MRLEVGDSTNDFYEIRIFYDHNSYRSKDSTDNKISSTFWNTTYLNHMIDVLKGREHIAKYMHFSCEYFHNRVNSTPCFLFDS